jgi:hypothetical protein
MVKPKSADPRPRVRSLGWDLLDWIADYLPSPRDHSSEFILTDEQAMLLVEWFRVDGEGRYVYRRGCSRRAKGWGKSPLEAAKIIAELTGEVVFDGWRADGQPQGRPWGTGGLPPAQIQVAACSEDQTDNTWLAAYDLLIANEGRAADLLRIDAGLTRFFLMDRPGGGKPVTASAGAREGAPDTYAVLDETHLWTPANGGTKLAATLRRNVAKMGGRSYETTNSFIPGEGSVAEGTWKAIQLGRGVFVDAVEAPIVIDGVEVTEDAPDEILEAALAVAYGDSWWIDKRRLVADIRDADTKWTDAERFFFNWNRKGEGRAVDPKRWAELLRPGGPPPVGARIGLGFDGSISEDSTALVGCTRDGRSFVVEVWERPLGEKSWRVPRLAVHAAVRRAFDTWDVGRMFGDPPKWWTELEEWAEEFRLPGRTDDERERVLLFDTNQTGRFARAVDRWLTGIREGSHTHDGDPVLTRHVEAAHLKKVRSTADEADSRTLYVVVKGEDGRKIDACVADVLAFEAAMTMPEEGRRKRVPLAAMV